MENKIAIGSLASILSRSCGKSKKVCEDFLREFFRVVADALQQGEPVKIKGFGTFKLSDVESRTSVNVSTGAPFEIAPHRKVVFTPAKEIASAINSPFEDFESVEMDDEMSVDLLVEDIINDEEEPQEPPINESPEKEEPLVGATSQENISDEDNVSKSRLEEGSDEEGEDDEITLEAYSSETIPPQNHEEIIAPSIPVDDTVSVQEYNLESEDKSPINTNVSLPVVYEQTKKGRFGVGFLIGALSTLLVCVIIFMLGCFFDWWPVNFGFLKNNNTENVAPVVEVSPVEETPEPENEIEAEPVYDTVSTTRYLTTIARDHYGNYNFWPYIYLENESILGHPDRITPGTQVVVPDLAKYGVDPDNKEDIERAKKKAVEIYSRFK